MTTLTITLDDSPEAQLIIQLLRQASVVTSVREDSSAETTVTTPAFPVSWPGNPELQVRPTESVWDGEPPTLEQIRQRDWNNRIAAVSHDSV